MNTRKRRTAWWSWFWFILGVLYFVLPLYATLDFSLRMQRGTLSLMAYEKAFSDPKFIQSFLYSCAIALFTIFAGTVIVVPTAYWVRLRLPQARRLVEFITLLPFVVPAIILVFGLIRIYSVPVYIPFTEIILFPPLTNSPTGTNLLLVAGYVVLAMPFMYRSVDTGLQAMDVRTLTEAAQGLGANWFTIMVRVILPNLRTAMLSGALLTFAIVVGELTLASFLNRPAFGPYLWYIGQHKAYEPAALAFVSFLMTWAALGLIQLISGGQNRNIASH